MKTRILSYNVNGIRAAINKGFLDWIEKEKPDIICLQETKIQEDLVDKMAFQYLGYEQFWFSAEKKGYSGVSILSKKKPDFISTGIGISKFDREGRFIRADFGNLTLVNSYFPSGTTGGIRQDFKMEYLEAISEWIDQLKKEKQDILICGDFNICHKPIDINHPERHKKSSGFLPEEREWMDRFLENGFIDSFRVFDQRPEQYSWWSYRANSRAKNLGWRIDYHMISKSMKGKLFNAGIMQKVMHSDHCPVWIDIDM